MGNLSQRALILHRRISRELESSELVAYRCNSYIDDLESLKDQFYEEGHDWIESFPNIDQVFEGDSFTDPADDDELEVVLQEARHQLERLLGKLGIDPQNSVPGRRQIQSQNMHAPINITVNPIMSQTVENNNNTIVQIQTERLEKEFDTECNKLFPDRGKLQKIVDQVKKLGPLAMPVAEQLMEKIGRMFLL